MPSPRGYLTSYLAFDTVVEGHVCTTPCTNVASVTVALTLTPTQSTNVWGYSYSSRTPGFVNFTITRCLGLLVLASYTVFCQLYNQPMFWGAIPFRRVHGCSVLSRKKIDTMAEGHCVRYQYVEVTLAKALNPQCNQPMFGGLGLPLLVSYTAAFLSTFLDTLFQKFWAPWLGTIVHDTNTTSGYPDFYPFRTPQNISLY